MADISGSNNGLNRPYRSPAAINWLAIALCPLVFWLLRGDLASMIFGLFLLGLFGYAGHLIMCALEDEEAGDLQRHPFPRKLTGAALMGVGVTLLSLIQTEAGIMSPVFGFVAFALAVVAFGVDMEMNLKVRLSRSASKDTRKLVDTAERVFAAIPLRVADLNEEVIDLQTQAFGRTILAKMNEHPDVIEQVAPELRHVLTEAAEATDQFAEEYAEDRDPLVRRRYMVLLKDLAEAFMLCIDELTETPEPEDTEIERDARLFAELTENSDG